MADGVKDTIRCISQAAVVARWRAIRSRRGTPQVAPRERCAGRDKNTFALLPEVK